MIARLRGRAVARTADGLVLDVNGVGYLVAASSGALRRAQGPGEVTIETYMYVRQDTLQLYGFAAPDERELFTQLMTVQGIGPKVALAVVSSAPTDELRRAIVTGDGVRFQTIPGIGKKTAERIVLELREKVGTVALAQISPAAGTTDHLTARDALVELGWAPVEAEQALAAIDSDLPPEERVRLALRSAA